MSAKLSSVTLLIKFCRGLYMHGTTGQATATSKDNHDNDDDNDNDSDDDNEHNH